MSSRDIAIEHYDVLVRLAKSESLAQGDLDSTLREVTEAAARTMGIERVNVWLLENRNTRIRCIQHYELSANEHSPGGSTLTAADYPDYFQALAEERAIVAHDAQSDPRTREFTEGYLDFHGITSMLDAPLHSGGDVVGIICHEHVGIARTWSAEEQKLAASLADLASLALESVERKQAVGAWQQSEVLRREIITGALDAIVIVDERCVITDWNPRAEIIFGWSREEAIGKSLYESIIPTKHHEDHRKGLLRFFETGEGPILNKRIEVTARDRAGREFPVELTISPISVGGTLVFSAFIRDITDRVRAELEIHKLNAELEERVHERTLQFQNAVKEKEDLLEELQAINVELLDRLCQLERKSQTIQSDLERAQVIQQALLPAAPPQIEGIHVDALYRPGMNVGGDLYNVLALGDGLLALYVADASGHGVAAAMLSVLFKQRLRVRGDDHAPLSPAEVLHRANAELSDDFLDGGLFLTAAYVLLDTRTGDMRAASAGHTPMFLRRASGENIFLNRTGPALGLVQDATFTEHQLALEHGDRLILYTDGLIDGLDTSTNEEILELLLPSLSDNGSQGPHPLRAVLADIHARASAEALGPGRDDVTLLILEADRGASTFDNEPPSDLPLEFPQPEALPSDRILWMAENERDTHLAVRGRGTWLHCEAFRRLAKDSIDSGRRLAIDLSRCSHLDSAFLGTLHEIISEDNDACATVRHPSATLLALFDELGLQSVLHRVRDESIPAPFEPAPVTQDLPARESQLRLLRAHEILSKLSDENKKRFAAFVQSLRKELGEDAE